jgi:hypothetical protein
MLIIWDITMSQWYGEEVRKEIRSVGGGVRVIILKRMLRFKSF